MRGKKLDGKLRDGALRGPQRLLDLERGVEELGQAREQVGGVDLGADLDRLALAEALEEHRAPLVVPASSRAP